jgi:UDP-glucose 4-epimerase
MPEKLICCASLPPATISSVPIKDFADEHEELANNEMETIIHVAGRVSVEGASTPLIYLETRSVRFAMPIEIAKQRKSVYRK